MPTLSEIRLKTDCRSCVNKCCSQPYDWVYLTAEEIDLLKVASGLPEEDFVIRRQNSNTGHTFRSLNLPCRFLDSETGECKVYESRPLVCRLFPFYPEPLTGDATLLPAQCGPNLHFLPSDSTDGWCLIDQEDSVRHWLTDLWREALLKT
jgi:Fe-S-cluster containining protein